MAPIKENEVFIDIESIFRQFKVDEPIKINIYSYIKSDLLESYDNKKDKFIKKWKDAKLLELGQALCDFGVEFHAKFIEDIIEYLYYIWTTRSPKKNIYHNFYIKMIYFYNIYKLVAWAHLVDDDIAKLYNKFVTQVYLNFPTNNKNANLDKSTKMDKSIIKKQSNSNNILINELERNSSTWLPIRMKEEYENNLNATEHIFKKTYNYNKVPANFLPIGHYMGTYPRYYINNNWVDYTEHKKTPIKENNIIVGYDTRSSNGIDIRFRLRRPHKKHSNEKGMICNSKSKKELYAIAKNLNIELGDIDAINDMCDIIRNRLLFLEIEERNKINGLKYFYTIIESDN